MSTEITDSLLPCFSALAMSAAYAGACFFGCRRSPRSASGFVVVVGFSSGSLCRQFAAFWLLRLPRSIPHVNVRPARGAALSAGAVVSVSVPVSLADLPLSCFSGPVSCALSC
jgi:hypothetical protein